MHLLARFARYAMTSVAAAATVGLASASPWCGAAVPGAPVAKVWVEPDATYAFLNAAIAGAHHRIDLCLYELRDPTVVDLLERRAAAGVRVDVLLNAAYRGRSENAAAFATLQAHAVHVAWAPSGQIFHAKYAVVDGRLYLGTGNLVAADEPTTRDFWVELTGPRQVAAVEATFAADFAGAGAAPVAAPGIVWSPGSTSTLVDLIASARRSLLVENEEMDDAAVEAALGDAAARHVAVTVVMTSSSSWTAALQALARRGVTVRLLASNQTYIHAKAICVDCSSGGTVFLGSENFSTSSLERNRELGVVTTNPSVVRTVAATIRGDAGAGQPVSAPRSPGGGSGSGGTTSTHGLTVTTFTASIARGAEDTLTVRTRAGASCSLAVTLPSGYASASHGLGATTASSGGLATWVWKIGSSTHPGTATAQVTCGAASATRTFQIL